MNPDKSSSTSSKEIDEDAENANEVEMKFQESPDSDDNEGDNKERYYGAPSLPKRTSSRQRKPVKRFKFDDENEEEENRDDENGEISHSKKGEKHNNGYDSEDDEVDMEKVDDMEEEEEEAEDFEEEPLFSPHQNPRRSASPSGRIKRLRRFFTPEERCNVFRFILDECKSKAPGKEGRIAKMKAQTTCSWFWEKFKEKYGYKRRAEVYRIHYNFYSKKLHVVPGLTLDERCDLYYAMDMPVVDKKDKAALIEKYGAIIDENNIVTGSTVLKHWDLTHSESDEDEEYRHNNVRFVEYQDGQMWQFMVNKINEGNDPLSYGTKLWRVFRDENNMLLIVNKTEMCYMNRCRRILVPNLHIMPFDIDAKAALYQSLEYPVPEEFREELITSTGLLLSSSGYVLDYPNRPHQIILQTHPHPTSSIGLTSTTAYSTLREPEVRVNVAQNDRNPWALTENKLILEYCRNKAIDEIGRTRRIMISEILEISFWENLAEHMTDRSPRNLVSRFNRLRQNLIHCNAVDPRLKLDLYYILSKPMDVEAGELFKSIAIVVIDENAIIRFAVGSNFLLGRMDNEQFEPEDFEHKYSFFFDCRVLIRIVGRSVEDPCDCLTEQEHVGRHVLEYINKLERNELKAMGITVGKTVRIYHKNQYQTKESDRSVNSKFSSRLPNSGKSKFEKVVGFDPEAPPTSAAGHDDDDRFMERRPSVALVSRIPTKPRPNPMEIIENAITKVEMHIQQFHNHLKESSKRMNDWKRLQCLADVEKLAGMFRLNADQALYASSAAPNTRKSG